MEAVVKAVIAVALAAIPAGACSYFFTPVPVSSTFSVLVLDRGRPLVGLRVRLEGEREGRKAVLTKVTDRAGRVRFEDVKPGSYYVYAWSDHPGLMGTEVVTVGSAAKAKEELQLQWPATPVVRARALAGVLHGTVANKTDSRAGGIPFSVYAPLAAEHLTVVAVPSGEKIWQGRTDAQGNFTGPQVPPGLYLMHIQETQGAEPKAWETLEGEVPVEITADPSLGTLDLELSMSSCGLSYTSGCQREHLAAPRACGSIVDEEGAVVARASVLLYAVGSEKVLRASSDADGRFDAGEVPAGEYRLLIGSPGFAAAVVPLTITAGGACGPGLRVTLAVAGRCSAAAVGADRP